MWIAIHQQGGCGHGPFTSKQAAERWADKNCTPRKEWKALEVLLVPKTDRGAA